MGFGSAGGGSPWCSRGLQQAQLAPVLGERLDAVEVAAEARDDEQTPEEGGDARRSAEAGDGTDGLDQALGRYPEFVATSQSEPPDGVDAQQFVGEDQGPVETMGGVDTLEERPACVIVGGNADGGSRSPVVVDEDRDEAAPGQPDATGCHGTPGRKPLPSRTKCSQRSVRRLAMTSALRASGNTLGQSLKARLVVMAVERRYS